MSPLLHEVTISECASVHPAGHAFYLIGRSFLSNKKAARMPLWVLSYLKKSLKATGSLYDLVICYLPEYSLNLPQYNCRWGIVKK